MTSQGTVALDLSESVTEERGVAGRTERAGHRGATAPKARSLSIVYVWDADYPWDVRTEKVCRTLTDAGHKVHIVARNKKQLATVEQLPEGTVHRMTPWRVLGRKLDTVLGFPAFFNPRWIALLDRVVRDNAADLIIVRDLPLCPTAVWAGKRAGVPVVLDMAEHYAAMMQSNIDVGRQGPFDFLVRNPKATAAVERWCLQHVDRTIVVVEESGERLVGDGVAPDRIHVVSNTPSVQRKAAPVTRVVRNDGIVEVVYLGILEVPRGIGELVEAVGLLRDENAPVRLTIVGAGRDEHLFRERAAALGLGEDRVRFLGFVPYAQALEIVAGADIGAIPHHSGDSWNYTIPNKLFDYMSAGLPVVCSDSPPAARVVREFGTGEVFTSRDPVSLAAAIRRLLPADARRAAAAAGRRAIDEKYNWEADAERLAEVIDLAIRGSRRVGA
jgi:glycosyltransferase involved in cell wall biosynthesis